MSKFELSDKELKQLLQNEGLEEPSMRFNRNVLHQISTYEKAQSIKTPLALKILFVVFMCIPLLLIFMNGGVDLGLNQEMSLPNFDLNFQLNNDYIYFTALAVGAIWLAVFFNKLINNRGSSTVKNS